MTCPEGCHCESPEFPAEECPPRIPRDEPYDEDVQYHNSRWVNALGIRRPGRWVNGEAWAESVEAIPHGSF